MRLWIALAVMLLAPFLAGAESIQVAAAISLREAITRAAQEYQADTGVAVELTFGSSGQLSTQIQNGAPIDLFISAANKQVDDLISRGHVLAGSRRSIACNTLVLIAPTDSTNPPANLASLTSDSVKRIAIGEPRSVPAGQYAMQALRSAGVADAVKDKLVFGTNVRQVLDYTERGEVSAALVYSTDVVAAAGRVRVMAGVDASAHEPISYPSVVVKASRRPEAATRFVDYLLSDRGQTILKQFGFTPPAANTTTQPSK